MLVSVVSSVSAQGDATAASSLRVLLASKYRLTLQRPGFVPD